MSVTALACGAVALALCWVPLLNLVAIVLALAGVVLGVVALVLAARGLHRGRRRAAAGVTASVLALVVSLVVDVLWVARSGDDVTDSTALPPARPAPSVTAPADSSAAASASAATPAPSPGSPAPPSAAAPAAPLEGLPLGTSATVGDYTVTITGVNTDADAAIAEANPYNKEPTGRYVLADVSVVYHGTDEGIPWAHLQMAFQGTDARDYSTSTCSAVVPRPGISQPNLRPGGASDYQVCFDLPAEAIAGGAVKAEFYLPSEPATWAVTG